MSVAAPFPPADGVVAAVRQTCRTVREASHIRLSDAHIDEFLRSLDHATFERLKGEHGVNFPLQFDSVLVETNFLAVLALLNTLSAYRKEFHTATGQGAYQNVIKLCFGLYIGSTEDTSTGKLSAQGLASLTPDEVANVWGVSLFEESKHASMPAVTVGQRGGAMNEVVQLIVDLCNDTGRQLQQNGYPDLGSFVLEAIKDSERVSQSKGEAAGVDAFLDKLIRGVPGFADMHLVDGQQPVYVLKKAFFLLYSLYARFSTKSSFPHKLPDPKWLPMFVDNVIPTMIKHFGILDYSQSNIPVLQAWAESSGAAQQDGAGVTEGPTFTREEAYRVRAASLDAGRAVVERAQALGSEVPWLASLTEADLDGYLWAVAKDEPALRRVPRLVERQTIMY